MFQAIILDMDGVIVDTEPIQLEAFRLFLDSFHIEVSESFLASLVGYSIQDNMADIKQRFFHGRSFDIEGAIKRRNRIYLQLIEQQPLQPLPGVMELISYCRANNVKLALASSSDRLQVDTIMNRLIDNYRRVFDCVVTGDDVNHKKPAPDIYLHVVNVLQVPANWCLAFEDSYAGILSAKSAGVICYAVRNRYADEKKLQYADRVIDTIEQALIHHFWID